MVRRLKVELGVIFRRTTGTRGESRTGVILLGAPLLRDGALFEQLAHEIDFWEGTQLEEVG